MRDLILDKARGQNAANVLNDEAFKDALKEVHYVAHRAFERAAGDPERLRRASDLLEAANTLQRYLISLLTMGQAAAKKLDADMDKGPIQRGIGRLVRNRAPVDMPWSRVA